MSPESARGPGPDDDLLAAEYALGVLPPDEHAALARRAAADPAFARLAAAWDESLLPLAGGFAPQAPPARLKAAVLARVFGRARLWERAGFWQAAAGLALAALVAVAVLPRLAPDLAPDLAPRLAAHLADAGGGVEYLALYDAARGRVDLAHVAGAPGAGRDFQLWVIPEGAAPVSLGVIPPGAAPGLDLDGAARGLVALGAVLAISLEPPGGSPTGQPTGPVVALGGLRAI